MSYFDWQANINFTGSSASQEASSSQPTQSNLIVIPTDNSPNQSFQSTLFVDGKNLTLAFFLAYNEMAGYWVMRISDPATGEIILDSIPLITGAYPASNILDQYAYLSIGSAYVFPATASNLDFPDDSSLGTAFLLVWGDTPQ